MDKLYTQTIGIPVVTDSGYRAGRVYDVILNTETGKIAGFLLGPSGRTVIAPVDVLSWNNALVVNDEDDILEIGEIHAVTEALKKRIPVMGNKVITKSGEYLGKVTDFVLHEKMFILTKIHVSKSVMGLFPYDKKIIVHNDILEIKKDAIIVKDPLRLTPVKQKVVPLKKLSVDAAPTG